MTSHKKGGCMKLDELENENVRADSFQSIQV
jgi:hypothetical protein